MTYKSGGLKVSRSTRLNTFILFRLNHTVKCILKLISALFILCNGCLGSFSSLSEYKENNFISPRGKMKNLF